MLKTDLAVAQVGQMASTLSEPAQLRLGEVGFDLSSATFCDKSPTSLGQKLAAFQSFFFKFAFITGNSSLESLFEGLCAQIHVNLR